MTIRLHLSTVNMTCAMFLLMALVTVSGQRAEKFVSQNPCVSKTTCSECIQTKSCAWCLQPQADYGDNARCFQPSYTDPALSKCPEEWTYNPDTELKQILNKELTIRGGSSSSGGMMAEEEYGSSFQSSHSSSSHGSSYQSSGGSAGGAASFGAASGGIVQIKPQRVNLKLRISKVLLKVGSENGFNWDFFFRPRI